MERICSWCKKYMGERCQRCGSERVKTLLEAQAADRLANDLGLPAPHRAFMRCEDCGNCWQQGSDGKTHGICQICRICGCTETVPCQIVVAICDEAIVVPYSWLDDDRDLCTARSCIEEAFRYIPKLYSNAPETEVSHVDD